MTYRRLFHILLIGSTLLLGGIWWNSFRTAAELVVASPTPEFRFTGAVVNAVILLTVQFAQSDHFTFTFYPAINIRNTFEPGLMGEFQYWKEPLPETASNITDYRYGLLLPIWVPYLIFIAGAWAFCRMMERRSKGGREKVLAEEKAGG